MAEAPHTLCRVIPAPSFMCSHAGAFLVRHGWSRILSEPRPRSQDETLGEVILQDTLCELYLKMSPPLHVSASFPNQWRYFHGDSRAHQPPGRLHCRLHRGRAARREPHPIGTVPLAPGEPGTGVRYTHSGTRRHTHTHSMY